METIPVELVCLIGEFITPKSMMSALLSLRPVLSAVRFSPGYKDRYIQNNLICHDSRRAYFHTFLGKYHGAFREYSSAELVQEEFFDLGKSMHVITRWYTGGAIMSHSDGKMMTAWRKSGKLLLIEEMADGKPHGLSTAYNKKGNVTYTQEYRNGVEHGLCIVYAQSPWGVYITGTILYINGVCEGFLIRYRKNGVIKTISTYRKGIQEGPVSHFYKYHPNTGNEVSIHIKRMLACCDDHRGLAKENPFVNNVINGTMTEWDEEGKVTGTTYFKDGRQYLLWHKLCDVTFAAK